MAACERCWAEYRARVFFGGEDSLTYSEVVAERDRRGGCTPEEQCGEMHIVINESCRCGKVTAPR